MPEIPRISTIFMPETGRKGLKPGGTRNLPQGVKRRLRTLGRGFQPNSETGGKRPIIQGVASLFLSKPSIMTLFSCSERQRRSPEDPRPKVTFLQPGRCTQQWCTLHASQGCPMYTPTNHGKEAYIPGWEGGAYTRVGIPEVLRGSEASPTVKRVGGRPRL